MDDQVQRLAKKAWTKFQTLDASQRLLIAIAGIPGSGKTTLASQVVQAINKLYHDDFARRHPNAPPGSQPNLAIVVPLDGFHLTRRQLAEMPNAEEAIFRRGAAFTFDSRSYYELVRRVRAPLEATTATIYAPSFDHAVKDPVPMDIGIAPTARIVVFEGLYVALNRHQDGDGGTTTNNNNGIWWRDAAELMDERWFVDVTFPVAADRVARRNFAAGISSSLEESKARTEANDMQNGREVVAELVDVHEVVQSIEDDGWRRQQQQQQPPPPQQQGAKGDKGEDQDWDEDEENDQLGQPGPHAHPPGRRQRLDSITELAQAGAGW